MLALLAIVALAAAGSPERLQLTCFGGGTANRVRTSSAQMSDNYGNSASGTVTTPYGRGFGDQVDLWIEGEDGRVRLPRTMLPPIHGGDDGWFKLKNVKTTDDTITASAGVNALNNPKLHLDRRTGSISINGKAGNFSGMCEKMDPTTQTRKF